MTRRERLMATLRGEPVDRPAVSFYEIGGFPIDPSDPDPFNVYNDPSWQPLLQLAEDQTDLIWMRLPQVHLPVENPFATTETFLQDGSQYTRTTWRIGGRTLTSLSRRAATAWRRNWVTETPLMDSGC